MTEHRTSKRTRLGRGVVALAGALLVLVAATGTAYASTGTGNGHPDFAAQARSARLTSSQAAALQARVDAYLAKMGGTQVAINKISLADRSVMLLALPGQEHARDLNASSAVQASATCSYHYFCAYRYTGFSGDEIDMYACRPYSIPGYWNGPGSWINNQSPGRKARMADRNGTTIYVTPGAPSDDRNGSWTPVWYVQPC
jgi:hypothetical protein